jgi:hypothetical protein
MDDGRGVQVEPRSERLEGDDIQVVPGEPSRRRSRALIIGTAVALVAGLIIVLALALHHDNKASAKPRVVVEPTTAPVVKHKAKPATKPKSKPKAKSHVVTPQTAAPIKVTPIAPPPTAAPPPTPAKLVATATPSSAMVRAGTPINVTLHVTNQGGTTGEFVYDNDGCPGKQLAPPADQICTEIAAILNVAPGATVDKVVTIYTSGAKPGVYNVAYDDGVAVKVTITK